MTSPSDAEVEAAALGIVQARTGKPYAGKDIMAEVAWHPGMADAVRDARAALVAAAEHAEGSARRFGFSNDEKRVLISKALRSCEHRPGSHDELVADQACTHLLIYVNEAIATARRAPPLEPSATGATG